MKGDKGDQGDVGPQGLMGPQGPAGLIADDSVDTNHIKDGAVTGDKLGAINDLHVNGLVQLGASSLSCSSALAGSLRFNAVTKNFEGCDGAAWRVLNMLPAPSPKRMFISSNMYPYNIMNLAYADAQCSTLASMANLGGTWKAWYSDQAGAAANRLNRNTLPYVNLVNQIVANDWADLTDGTLDAPVIYNEMRYPMNPSEPIITNTDSAGNWMLSSCASNGLTGLGTIGDTGSSWTYAIRVSCIGASARLLCVEQ
jgi:hypothetical protein